MFPLLALAALAGFAGYQYSKARNSGSTTTTIEKPKETTADKESSNARAANIYNYYTNDSETGNTLFGSQKKTKRTLFGGETV